MAFFKRKRVQQRKNRPKNAVPDGLWMKCANCQRTVYRSDVLENLMVCPECGYHYRIGAQERIEQLLDPGSFEETHTNLRALDPLEFAVGDGSYLERIERAKAQSGLHDALITGFAAIEGTRAAVAILDAGFIMASMGGAMGEKFCRFVDDAVRERAPVLVVVASGGARMQEGILALMQMAKTVHAVEHLKAAGLPYITLLTDPTTGGVLASFASLGDIVLAEPGAYIGFAGARLITGALNVELPEGFQSAEYQFENGFIDRIVPRGELRPFLGRLLRYLDPAHKSPAATG